MSSLNEASIESFSKVSYLGFRSCNETNNTERIRNLMTDFNSKVDGSEVSLSLSLENETKSLQILFSNLSSQSFPIHKIQIVIAGSDSDSNVFSFVFSPTLFERELHVFRIDEENFESKISIIVRLISQAVEEKDKKDKKTIENLILDVTLEIQEYSSDLYSDVPFYKNVFKLRSNLLKKIILTFEKDFKIERCFGMIVSPDTKSSAPSDIQLLENLTTSSDGRILSGIWDPKDSTSLNNEGPLLSTLMITADVVMSAIEKPVRFTIETKVRIYSQNEKFYYYTKRVLRHRFAVQFPSLEDYIELSFVQSSSNETKDVKNSLTHQLASTLVSLVRNPSSMNYKENEVVEEEEDDVEEEEEEAGVEEEDEPVLSGFGEVSKDWTSELNTWSLMLAEWTSISLYPKGLPVLVRRGIPQALRGEVWQRLTGTSSQQDEIVETYKSLLVKESPDEKVILRDIHRTFPAHEFFKEVGGDGQESLYRISKAYSVYDSEIGYCQGQSFLIAALLLQMPEEQAFGVLVKIMQERGLRDIYRENFEQLQLRLFQLDRLMEVTIPDLFSHFVSVGLESHMYASQWFLTLFTAKFPLFLVFRVLDVFLLDGFESIFQVALAILKVSRRDMLQLDFEGLMKYFRVKIPKRYRSEENAKTLLEVATQIKLKKLKKYEKEWLALKEAERASEDPLLRLEKDNNKLLHVVHRLEAENDNIARQLVNAKIEMRKEIDGLEDERDSWMKDKYNLELSLLEITEEKKRLYEETESLKILLKREIDILENELRVKDNIIRDYKGIISQLSSQEETESPVDEVDSTLKEVRDLELELAQTKLALVESECKNQDLIHQASSKQDDISKNTWFLKTLSSIKETAVSRTVTASSSNIIRKSSSVNGLS